MIKEFVFGMPRGRITQDLANVREQTWDAIFVTEDGVSPPPEHAFPWLWVGLGAAAAVGIVMAKSQHRD